MTKPKVMFLCTGNSARSQMAEGYLRKIAGERFEVLSAGIAPKGVNSLAIEAMQEAGCDISGQRSKDVQELLGTPVQYVVTVCSNAKEKCPIFPSAYKFLHWDLEDPAAAEAREKKSWRCFEKSGTRFSRTSNENLAASARKMQSSRARGCVAEAISAILFYRWLVF